MPTSAEIEKLRDLCTRFCAVSAGEEEVRSGRFDFIGNGKNGRTKGATKQCAAVPFGDVTDTFHNVVDRVTMVMSESTGRLYVRAYYEGDTHHSGAVYIDPDPGTDLDNTEDAPSGPNALAVAHARIVLGQMRQNEELMQLAIGQSQEITQLTVGSALHQLAAIQAHENGTGAAAAAMLQTLEPTINKATEMLIQQWADDKKKPRPEDAHAPSDPTAKVDFYLDRIEYDVDGLFSHVKKDPGVVTDGHRARIAKMLAKFTGGGETPPQQEGSDGAS